MADKKTIITLTTDFGAADYFVHALKGDIYSAAFTLMCCYKDFPKMTIHVVVVDPGVGSSRRAIMVMTDNYIFIGPDNGVFSYIYQREHVNRVVHFNEEHYFRTPVSNTFHGRDIFAPCAAYVAKPVEWRKMGVEVSDPVHFNTPIPVASEKQIRGHV